ncbi:MAG TPA: glycosyltransferase family 2 protein [Planctomycetota bacterium]
MQPDLSVIMPVFNEASTIEAILNRVLAMPSLREVVVVDDGSTDHTREKLDLLAGRTPIIKVVRQSRNQGKGAAIREGFKRATGTFIVVQDADLEYDPADIEALLEVLRAGRADVVYGSRYLTRSRAEWWHTLGNRSLTWLSNLLTARHLTDMVTCYKLIPARIARVLPLRSDGFSFEPEVTALLARRGLRFAERPISYERRGYAEGKKIGWKDAVRAVAVMLDRAIFR